MPHRPRLVLPDLPPYLIEHGNDRQARFIAGEDYRPYLDWLARHAFGN
ncbi:MAG: hypothetical protein LBS49_08510 [Candidatus Accumulibacter sp.]|jgi:putative transposase|nr:hypothetical protein [Accumulibacter sp.]